MTQLVYKLSPANSAERQILGETGPKITNYTIGETPDGKMAYTLKFKIPRVGARGESGFATLRLDAPLPGLLDWKVINHGEEKVFRHVKSGAETPALQIAARKMIVTVGGKPDGKNYLQCEIQGFTADARVKAWGNYVNSEVKTLSALTLPDDDDETTTTTGSEDDIDI